MVSFLIFHQHSNDKVHDQPHADYTTEVDKVVKSAEGLEEVEILRMFFILFLLIFLLLPALLTSLGHLQVDPDGIMVVLITSDPINSGEPETVHPDHNFDHLIQHKLLELSSGHIFDYHCFVSFLSLFLIPNIRSPLDDL